MGADNTFGEENFNPEPTDKKTAEEFYQSKNGGKSALDSTVDGEWISPTYAVMLMEEYASQKPQGGEMKRHELIDLFTKYKVRSRYKPMYEIADMIIDGFKSVQTDISLSLPTDERECCHPYAYVLGNGDTEPARCLKCGEEL